MTTRFRFPLQSLLWLREQREKEAERVLARLLAEERAAATALEDARAALARAEAALSEARDAASLRGAATVVDFARGRLRTAAAALQLAQARAADERARYLLRRQERRVVERLKEKRWAAHQVEQLRHEQAQLDEIAISRHVRSDS